MAASEMMVWKPVVLGLLEQQGKVSIGDVRAVLFERRLPFSDRQLGNFLKEENRRRRSKAKKVETLAESAAPTQQSDWAALREKVAALTKENAELREELAEARQEAKEAKEELDKTQLLLKEVRLKVGTVDGPAEMGLEAALADHVALLT